MIPIIPLILRLRLLRRKRSYAKTVLMLPLAAALMGLSSCNDEHSTKPVPQVAVTDTQPVGAGLTVIGFAIVGAAVVVVLGRLLR